jgi:Acyl-CoA thioesterase C-terminal domain/Acyl-CoA thioesterase N-terminal domain
MTGVFEQATAVQRVEADETTTGPPRHARFDAAVQPGWDIGGHANGGYVLAIAARAMSAVTGRPPLTVSAHYLAPAPAGPCHVDVSLVRAGRRTATATAALVQGDREILRALGTFADQVDGGPTLITGGPPELPPYADCIRPSPPDFAPFPALNERLAVRLRPGDGDFRDGRPTGVAEIAGWFAFADERPVDAIGLLFVADAFAPAVFNTGLPIAWVPTVELTVHVRGVPAAGPLRCLFRSRFIQGGLLEEDGEVWDSAGRLVAQSRQLALTPR